MIHGTNVVYFLYFPKEWHYWFLPMYWYKCTSGMGFFLCFKQIFRSFLFDNPFSVLKFKFLNWKFFQFKLYIVVFRYFQMLNTECQSDFDVYIPANDSDANQCTRINFLNVYTVVLICKTNKIQFILKLPQIFSRLALVQSFTIGSYRYIQKVKKCSRAQ